MMNSEIETGISVAKPPTPIVRDADKLFRRGVDALERNRFDEAAGLLRQAAELAPQSSATHLALGIALTRLTEIPAAFDALETAIKLDPNGFFPHFRMGELYMRVGVPTKGNEELQIAMDVSTTPEQRALVRELVKLDAKRAQRRVWRPDFSKLIGRRRKDS
jgi:Tfp pilus assembly protein PilF